MIKWSHTESGFRRGEFRDLYGAPCSIRASSLPSEDCIWLGCEHESYDDDGRPIGARMHLTREMAGELAKILLEFSYTGELPP
jgi:hypothetical protein